MVNYGTDIPNLQGHHKRYLYGPGSILVTLHPKAILLISMLTVFRSRLHILIMSMSACQTYKRQLTVMKP